MTDPEETTDTKVAVVTGASSGIGHATALEFAKQGYNVVLVARREPLLRKVAEACEQFGVRPLIVGVDVAKEGSAQEIASTALRAFGRIDIWVNDAGVYLAGKFEDTPIEDMRRVMDVNFFGTVYGSRVALAQFREQGYGTLINVSSVNAAAPQPYIGLYGATKAAIRGLDESLRMELRLEGLDKTINVCTVMPASIDTNLFQNAANYTGRRVQALEPVYDAIHTARHIVRLANKPRREIKIGPAGRFMALQNAHAPRSYEKQIGKFTRKDMLDEQPAPASKGNLYEPIEENTGISGGWRDSRVRADQLNIAVGLAAAIMAAAAVGASIAMAKKRRAGA